MCESTNYCGDMSIGKKPECMVLREDCERLAKMVSDREKRIDRLENTIQRKEEAIEGLTNELKAQDKRFAKERENFMGYNEHIHEKCQMLTGKLEDVNKIVQGKNAFIDALHEKMNQMDEDLRAKDEKIENLKKMINRIYGTEAFEYAHSSEVIGVLRDIAADTDGVSVLIELTDKAATVLYTKAFAELQDRLLHVGDLIECGRPIKEPPSMKEEVFSPGDRNYDEIAQDFRKKYEALLRAGFNSDQAMQFLPMWWDESEGDE